MKGHIRRGRVDGTWYLRVELARPTGGSRRQRREKFVGTKVEALKRLRELLREVEMGGYADSARLSVADVAHRWLETKEHRLAASTFAFYAGHVRLYIIPTLGSLRAETLRPAHIEAAIAQLARGGRNDRQKGLLSARTVAHCLNTVRTMLRWAVKMGMLVRNVAESVDPPRSERHEMQALDAAGVAAVLEAAAETELQTAIAVAVGTGLRRGELLGLRWSDVDLTANRLAVRRSVERVSGVTRTKPPKTLRSARTIALPPFIADILRSEHAKHAARCLNRGSGRDEDGWVFVRINGSQWEPGAFSLAFARFVKHKKLPHVRFHDLRHSFGTLALASGVDLQTVSRALGHESVAITSRIYVHAVEALEVEAAARLDALLGKTVAAAMAGPNRPSSKSVGATTVPQVSWHAQNINKNRTFLVAPTGIEPVFPP
jgi:integrase